MNGYAPMDGNALAAALLAPRPAEISGDGITWTHDEEMIIRRRPSR